LLDPLLTLLEQDGELARLLKELPQALGSGVLLQVLFARLFPGRPQPIASSLPYPAQESPSLGPRELAVLQEMAQGHCKKEIAKHLSIRPATVRSHFNNIYRKLQVTGPQEAVVKAVSLGLLPFDFADLLHPLQDRYDLDFNAFVHPFLTGISHWQREGRDETLRQLAALGLLLFLSAPLVRLIRGDGYTSARRAPGKGLLLEFTPDGRLVRSFGGEGNLRCPCALAFAPPAAEHQGFCPGHLFLLDLLACPNPLNTASLVELTPEGRTIRAFTGSAYLSTRLHNSYAMAFTVDGRLLATSGGFTDAVLEFTAGGGRVRRFANLVPYGGLTTDRRGHVYVAGGWSEESPIHVFGPQGDLLRTVGAARSNVYQGVAVDDGGRLYVANFHEHVLEVYDARGHRRSSIGEGDLSRPWRLALGPHGRLYVTDGDGQAIKVFTSGGTFLFSLPAPPGTELNGLTFGPNGNLFVAGQAVHE
jgi:DNA-binding CsgD family transcriptional regulator/sugar lactone lactonase YvrE